MSEGSLAPLGASLEQQRRVQPGRVAVPLFVAVVHPRFVRVQTGQRGAAELEDISRVSHAKLPPSPAVLLALASPHMAARVVLAAEAVARAHHARYDPSHDFHHITRVRGLALAIARSLAPQQQPDPVVVELAALFHDLLDKKYLPEPIPTAREHLAPFWDEHGRTDVSDEQRRLVERIVENVSYSKEVKRIAAGQQTEWHLTCPELHWCV